MSVCLNPVVGYAVTNFHMNLDLATLNPEQLEAVEYTEGPLLILAGAGSGKTKVLTYRIAYILEKQLAYPEEILAVTFTNKAAAEMKERIAKLLGSSVPLPWMGTFHSICVKILRRDGQNIGLGPNFSIYDPSDQLETVKQAMEQLNLSIKDVNPRAIHSHISSAKNEMVEPADYAGYAKGYFQETVAAVYPEYQKILKQNNAVDFDDLLMYVVRLFKQHPQVLEKYQNLFKYIMVDEYQDTNNVQYLMMKGLAEKRKNVCAVGDDDQSIYSFRGANIRNILNFHRDYPNAKIVKLEQNYRSTKKILDAAHAVVRKNKQRTDKKLWTENATGEDIYMYTAENERDEADWVVRKIKSLEKDGVDPSEIAILYRTNAQSRTLEEACVRGGIGYHIVGGVKFYERKEIKDVLAYLRSIHNPADDGSIKRIINVPKRSIGAKSIADLQAKAQESGASLSTFLLNNSDWDNKNVAEFARVWGDLNAKAQDLNIVELINYILEATKYWDMLQDGTAENESRVENLKELLSVASKYAEYDPQTSLTLFLEEVALVEGDTGNGEEGAEITMMTIHAAKGLEFEHVFLVGVEEGLFPHSRVFTAPDELEEERRLAYVAITRAKKNLYMVHAESRLYFGNRENNMISRFATDIPDELLNKESYGASTWQEYGQKAKKSIWEDDWGEVKLPEIKSGDRVKHQYFGIGTVLSVNESVVKIQFSGVFGTKELAREFAPLEKV